MSLFSAKVKSVLSGDTVILTPPNKPDQERTLSLAYVTAPRLNTNEPYGFASREYLRTLLVGKQIRFKVLYEINGREYGDISAPVFSSLVENSLAEGNAKLRDDAAGKSGYEDVAGILEAAQSKGISSKKGVWSESLPVVNAESIAPQEDENKQYEAIVERVISGDRLQLRVILDKKNHYVGPALVAGIRAPRSTSPDAAAEPYGDVAKTFVSTRLLQRNVGAKFIAKSSNGIPIVIIVHPAGDIAQLLLSNGLVNIADWQSQFLGAAKMTTLRAAEKQAKIARINLFKDAATSAGTGAKPKSYDAEIAKVISPDTYVVRTAAGEETVQLASIRAPRKNDSAQAPFVNDAKEFARSKFISKNARVTVEAIRPKSEQFEERPLVSIVIQDKNIASLLVQSGWATVVRHRKDDDDRSPIWDELLEYEQHAIKGNKGIHSKKAPAPDRIVDASENVTKARGFLSSLERQGKVSAVVEHVSSGGRLRLRVPKENCNLWLVLAGIRVPKPTEDHGDKALAFVSQKLYQRDVQFSVQNVDKTGAFIGNIWIPGNAIPLSVVLTKSGLAEVHDFSAQSSGFYTQLTEAEEEAKTAKRAIWTNYTPAEPEQYSAAAPNSASTTSSSSRNYTDITVTDISNDGEISYRTKSSEPQYTKLIADLTSYNSAAANSASFAFPSGSAKRGELVTLVSGSKFSRAKVIGIEKPKVVVQELDTGKVSTVSSSSLRPLPAQFKSSPLAKTAILSFVQSPPTAYMDEYIGLLEAQLLGKSVVANVDNAGPPESVTIYTANSKGPDDSLNSFIVDEGYAFVKPQLAPWERQGAWKSVLEALQELEEGAKSDRIGVWEYGDPRNID